MLSEFIRYFFLFLTLFEQSLSIFFAHEEYLRELVCLRNMHQVRAIFSEMELKLFITQRCNENKCSRKTSRTGFVVCGCFRFG